MIDQLPPVPRLDNIGSTDEEPLVLEIIAGGQRYGVAPRHILSVTPLGTLTPLPGQQPPLLGVTLVRGTIVAVADLARMLAGAASQPEQRRFVLLTVAAGLQLGLVITTAGELLPLDPAERCVLPPANAPVASGLVRAWYRQPGGLLPVLDIHALCRFDTPPAKAG